ncbi:predicted protein [Histoplasma capsulatum H143]|uniref:Uncharacterized protein n=1 Tax=Ajellomyces capsulatus (strain H143) TaxID=544712 RepID=C6H6W8_AJECH|nr:predicted protein [Histoplasma capsulatum H143]
MFSRPRVFLGSFRNDESLKPRSKEQAAEVDEGRYEITNSSGLKKRCHKVGKPCPFRKSKFIPGGIISFAQRHKNSNGLTLHRCTQQRVPRQQQAHKCDQEANLKVIKTFLEPGDPMETSLCPYESLAHP